jgi:PHP family Zn ribbon phosphoesterase
MFSEFQKAQAERDARILAAYGVNPYIGDMKTTIEKGGSKGEGSRGGKVIRYP